MGLIRNLRMAWKNRAALKATSNALDKIQEANVKDGYKTTEFWLTVVAQAGNILATMNGILDPKTAAIIGAVQVALYSILRTLSKVPAPAQIDPNRPK